jgi:hypothetical protein
MKRSIIIGMLAAGLALVAGLGWFASANAAIVTHWNIYAASGPTHRYTLFLGPFPNARTCNVEAREIVRAGGRAYCASQTELSFDRKREAALFWEFLSAANPWSKICGKRYAST